MRSFPSQLTSCCSWLYSCFSCSATTVQKAFISYPLFRQRFTCSLTTTWIERVSIQCRKTKTKVITLANQKGRRQSRKPIKTRSNYTQPTQSAGKCARASHYWFWFHFWLIEKNGARTLNQSREETVDWSQSKLYCVIIIIPHPSTITAKDRCRNSPPIYRPMVSWSYPMCRAFRKGLGELRQQQIKVVFKQLRSRTVKVCSRDRKTRKRLTGHNLAKWRKSVAPTAVLYTTVKLNDQLKLGLQNTKGLFLYSTMTPRSPAMSTKTTTKWILEVSELLDTRLTFTCDFSWKPGFQ